MIYNRIKYNSKLAFEPFYSVFNHLHLLAGFVGREIKGRFVGSFAGALWTFMTPLANIIVYLFIFSLVLRIQISAQETGTDIFAIFFLTGFFPWLMFAESLGRSANILIENSNLITKVVFPVELLPVGVLVSSFIINGIGLLIFLPYLVYHSYLNITWLFLFILIPLQFIFTLGLAFLFSAMCVFIRDIKELLAIILMLWFYATPIIYPFSMIPDMLKDYLLFNPMTYFVGSYRSILLMHKINMMIFYKIAFISFFSYSIGSWFFMRAKSAFGDVL